MYNDNDIDVWFEIKTGEMNIEQNTNTQGADKQTDREENKKFASFWGYRGFIYFFAKNTEGLSWGLKILRVFGDTWGLSIIPPKIQGVYHGVYQR